MGNHNIYSNYIVYDFRGRGPSGYTDPNNLSFSRNIAEIKSVISCANVNRQKITL